MGFVSKYATNEWEAELEAWGTCGSQSHRAVNRVDASHARIDDESGPLLSKRAWHKERERE